MSRRISLAGSLLVTIVLAFFTAAFTHRESESDWTDEELRLIESLSLESLPPLPADPSNRVADDPVAASLGEALFFDTRMSANGEVACASCHMPDRQFQDGLARAKGVGTTNRRTMPVAGMAYSPWLFWDGRKDSLWSQALGPLESPAEHSTDRTAVAWLVAEHFAERYEQVFGLLPSLDGLPPHAAPNGTAEVTEAWKGMDQSERDTVNRVFANVGKAIAAFERGIMPGASRFDRYAAARTSGETPAADIMTDQELEGLRIFIGKGSCINCHNGALFTDNHFHNTGVPAVLGLPEDTGRAAGAPAVRADPFNCLGRYSDAAPEDCSELRFMTAKGHELERAYKAPSLRNVASRPPYMHAGQIGTLAEVVDHYNRAPAAPAGHSELQPLGLASEELAALEAFLRSLDEEAPTYRHASRRVPPSQGAAMRHFDLINLNRILGLLGSDDAGARAAAGLAADRLVKTMGTSWWTLIGTGTTPRKNISPTTIVTKHEFGVDHARAAQSRIRQLRTENDLLRKKIASLRNRISNLTAQERRARYSKPQEAAEYRA